MLVTKLFWAIFAFVSCIHVAAVPTKGKAGALINSEKRALLQDLVTWDEHTIFVRGERILFYSGEFHPFRLPVPGLWLDVFQKIKALGYSGVSFYVDWALVEGQPGVFNASGIFDLVPFFDAASEAGIYLLARPGPYINAEVSGGGFPGWLQRIKGTLRTNATDYLQATNNYAANIGAIIAKAQITNGGPVILVQPENEYSSPSNGIPFPNGEYFAYVEQQLRNASIIVPFIDNDAAPQGLFAPGNGTGSVDIYGHDSYPLGFDCSNPYIWPNNSLPTYFRTLHLEQSPSTPYSLVEFQGGSFDPWGGAGFAKCTTLLNEQFERVFYKNDFSAGVTIFNIYMTYGGTNWGNLGHPLGYTSYDYGAPIDEARQITREKYSEAKLLANFLIASPAYLTATPGNFSNSTYTDTEAITTTPLFGNGSATNFYVVRHSAYNSNDSTSYTLTVPTAEQGTITVPQLTNFGTSLTLNGRDSKIHVTDYQVGAINLEYSTADIFTWQNYTSGTVLVLYGSAGETHEFAVSTSLGKFTTSGSVASKVIGNSQVFQWSVTPSRQVVSFGNLQVYLLWINEAYNWYALELPAPAPIGNYTSPSKTRAIVKAGYLLRSASITGNSLSIVGDVNATTTIEVAGGMPQNGQLYFNGKQISTTKTADGTYTGTIDYSTPSLSIPDLSSLQWRAIDSLPEIQSNYSDAAWTKCNNPTSNNPLALSTPYSLYASDYGYHGGSLIYRGHFTTGSDSSTLSPELILLTQGGTAYGYEVWLNSTQVFTFPGNSFAMNDTRSIPLGQLQPSTPYVITVVIDHMGLTENGKPGGDTMKQPRGVLSYNLTSYPQSAVSWLITGNLGGEEYIDKTRGPLNEGASYAERQGYHLPNPPSQNWQISSPYEGSSAPGITFYSTSFNLSLPTPEYDIPLSFVFTNTSQPSLNFRAQLFVNGYQFGKYVNNIGPQTAYPVPEGILNYEGENWVGLTLWAFDEGGAKLDGFELQAGLPILTGRGTVALSPLPGWERRPGAY